MRRLSSWLLFSCLIGVAAATLSSSADGEALGLAYRFDAEKEQSGFSVKGPAGEAFVLRLSTDFRVWEPVWADTLSPDGAWCPDAFALTGPTRFYQVGLEETELSPGAPDRSEALPFELIRLPVEGLDPLAATAVRVFGSDGYIAHASIVELNTADIVFSVPFGPPQWGQEPMPVALQVVQRKDAQVRISPNVRGFRVLPPPHQAVPVGAVTLAWLEAAKEGAYGNLDAVTGTGFDTPEVLEALAAEIAAAEYLLEQLAALQDNPEGKIALGSINDSPVWLTHADLAWTDRLLLCLLHAIGNEGTLMASAAASSGIRKMAAGEECMRSAARSALLAATGESNASLNPLINEVVIAPRASILCKTSFAMRQGMSVVLGAGAVATGSFLLWLGAAASSALALPSAALLALNLQMAGGQIALGGALNQDSVAARELVQDGANRLETLAYEQLKPPVNPRIEGSLQLLSGFLSLNQAVAAAQPQEPRPNCDDCLPLYERLSEGCGDLPNLIDQSNCLNAALDAWMDCLERCEWSW